MDYNKGAGLGYIWLNRIFVKRGSSFRLWKTADIRISRFELVVIVTLALLLMAISVPVIITLMKWSFIADNINLWPFIFVNLIVAWMAGRSLAKASPYSRFTGENIFDWLAVTSDKRNTVLGRMVGHRVAVNEVTTWISGKPQPVEAIEWLGSARAPDAPPRKAHMDDDHLVDVRLVPLVVATDWVEQTRAAARSSFVRSHAPGSDALAPVTSVVHVPDSASHAQTLEGPRARPAPPAEPLVSHVPARSFAAVTALPVERERRSDRKDRAEAQRAARKAGF